MPVYNGELYLREAMDSVLAQTFQNFEFLIIDDGSTDASANIVRSYKDSRIRLEHNGKNLGLIATLNKGLELARGEYVARMDCDDISLPERLAVQARVMDENKSWGACGAWIKIFDGSGDRLVQPYSTDPDTLICELLFNPPMAHPSVIFRRELFGTLGLRYDASYKNAEDYELWYRASRHMMLSNIPKVLLLYRSHPRQVGMKYYREQQSVAGRIRIRQLESLGIYPTEEEFGVHQTICNPDKEEIPKKFLDRAEEWLYRLKKANSRTLVFPEPAFSKVLGVRWLAVCYFSPGGRARKIGRFFASPFGRDAIADWRRLVRRIVPGSGSLG
jgi:glycosyltransferase involved in cell wall biosynthesis